MGYTHLNTPKKATFRATFYRRRKNESYADIFRQFGISRTTGYKILREPP